MKEKEMPKNTRGVDQLLGVVRPNEGTSMDLKGNPIEFFRLL